MADDRNIAQSAIEVLKNLRGSGAPLAARTNDIINNLLGPHLRASIAPVVALADVASMGADIRDTMEFSGDTVDSLRAGDYGKAAIDALYTAAAPLGIVLPGNLGALRSVTGKAKITGGDASPSGIAKVGDNNPPPSMYDLPAGSDPRYVGAAPDRNPFSLLRYRPKSETPRVQASIEAISDPKNPMRQQLEADIDRGLQVGGADWYNTEELRDWFVKELGEERGNFEWAEFIDLVGAASPGSKVPQNIRNASAMRQRLYTDPEYIKMLEGVSSIDEARAIARGRLKGYGHKTQGLQEQILSKQQAGRWSGEPEPGVAPTKGTGTENPKPKGFSWSLKGSEQNIAADLHFTRYVAMASRDPRWLTTQAEVGAADAARLLALGPRKLKKYFGERTVDGKTQRTFNAKKAEKDGAVSVDEIADLGLPAMWSEKPNTSEYRALEKLMYDIGQQRGLTAPQVQASLWMGAADRTGVDVSSQKTFMEAMRSVSDNRAGIEGMTREEVLRRFIRDKGLLALPAVGVAGAMGSQALSQQDGFDYGALGSVAEESNGQRSN